MSDPQNTRISVTNIKNNEIVNYPLVLLKGTIEHYNCNESSKPNISSRSTNDCTVSKASKNQSRTAFKILIELKLGENIIDIDFCCSSLNMKLTYQRRKSSLNVVTMYIINNGHCGQFQASLSEDNSPQSACKRILTGSKLAQCLIAEKLYEEGLGRKTFQLENDECVIFRSNLNYKLARKMSQEELWAHIGREIMNSEIGSENKKYLGFLSCTKYNGERNSVQSYEDMIKVTEGHVALGGGGLALFGTACLHTWPRSVDEVISRFKDDTPVDRGKFMDDSCYRGTYGTCFTTTLGSVLHELCHTFDLGHTYEGIMDRGFDNLHKFFMIVNDTLSHAEGNSSNHSRSNLSHNITLNSNGIIRNPTSVQTNSARRKFEDDTYFTRSCSVILYYHRYFNDFVSHCDRYTLKFDRHTSFVKSTLGIRVIEIRRGANEMVQQNWVFPAKVLKYSFHIPKDCLNHTDIIFVEDNAGNILKEFYK